MRALTIALASAALGLAATAAAQDVSTSDGELDASSQRDSQGRPYSDWDIFMNAGEQVRVRVDTRSENLDPLLEIFRRDDRGTALARDDDSGGYPTPLLEFTAPRDDVYSFRVLSYHEGGGRYSMRIEKLDGMDRLQAVNEGGFSNSAERTAEGSHYRDYRLALREGQQVLLRLDAADFDALLRVYAAGGEGGDPVASDDDGGEGLNSMLLFRAPRTGSYTVRATQLSHGDGAYTLRMNRVD